MLITLGKKEKNKNGNEDYLPTDIMEKSNKLSGDWLEREVRKNHPEVFADSGDEADDESEE